MGRLILKNGDLFTTTQPIIAHGVNCSNGFASGVAGQVARLFPDVKRCYHHKFESDGWNLGDVQVVQLAGHAPLEYVANLGAQRYYGRVPGRVYVDYDGLALAAGRLLDFAADAGLGVAMPRIGCGLAGGDWARVLEILNKAVADRDVEVEVWTP